MTRAGQIAIALGIGAFAAVILFGFWQVTRLAQEHTREEARVRVVNTPLQRCLGENLAPDMSPRAWRAIQLACETVVRNGDPAPAAQCVLERRQEVLQDETTDSALESCGFSIGTDEGSR